MAKRKRKISPPSLKRRSFLRHSAVKVPQRSCVAAITSVKINSQSGSTSFLKTQHLSLNQAVSRPRKLPSESLNWSNTLGD